MNWFELAAGLWPEFKAAQLIQHAALCDHCGPLLRAATRMEHYPTPAEQRMVAGLTVRQHNEAPAPPSRRLPIWLSTKWFAAAMALILLAGSVGCEAVGIVAATNRKSNCRIRGRHAPAACSRNSSTRYAHRLAVGFERVVQNEIAVCAVVAGIGSSSQRTKAVQPGGARLVSVGGKTGAFVAYRISGAQTHLASASLTLPRIPWPSRAEESRPVSRRLAFTTREWVASRWLRGPRTV